MALCDELLHQAHVLATIDSGVPSQANLRRALSAAYYAVFHLLVSEAVITLVPVQPRGLRERVNRAFSHADMQKVCSSLQKAPLGAEFTNKFGTLFSSGVSDDLVFVAECFTSLQQARHSADYDVSSFYVRPAVTAQIAQVRLAFAAWLRIRNSDEANVFLTALAFGARWAK